jgi:hypothetical protein
MANGAKRTICKRPAAAWSRARFPHSKKRVKRSVAKAARTSQALAAARKARAKAKRQRKKLAASGILYTPKEQVVKRVRRGRASLKLQFTLGDVLALSKKACWELLVLYGFLVDLEGQPCQSCGWPLGKVELQAGSRHPSFKCWHRDCLSRNSPTAGTWADHEVPLQKLAALAWLASGMLSRTVGEDDAALMTGVSHKVCGLVLSDLRSAIHLQSQREQDSITCTGQREGDATTVRVVRLSNGRLLHVRFFGLCRRGDPTTTVCYPMPTYTTPAGGKTRPERIDETDHLITKHTGPEALVWHTDGARCYRHLPCRTSVKHAKKIWSAVRKVKLSEDDVLVCYGGTQLQDGLWSHLKNAIPRTLNTAQELSIDTLNKYASFWVWKFRRSVSLDLFSELGATVRAAREAGDIW